MPRRSVEPAAPYFLTVRAGPSGAPFWEVAWRHRAANGTTKPVKRIIGPAWLDHDGTDWIKRPGRRPSTHLDRQAATVAADRLVQKTDATFLAAADEQEAARNAPVTFREVAAGYVQWLEEVRGAKPSTLRDYASLLAEPGAPHRRGAGTSPGLIMAALGDRPARAITTSEVNQLLRTVQSTGVSARSVNKTRSLVGGVFA